MIIKAIILAAGVGSRLREVIDTKPKCLTRVNGVPVIRRQIDALLANGVAEVLVVGGHQLSVLEAWLATEYAGRPVRLVRNHDYATTNNMYSLGLCSELVRGGNFLLMNGDVAFDPEVINRILRCPGSAVAVDCSAYHEESMKVIRSPLGDFIGGISKKILPSEALASSIDVYRFSAADGIILLDHVHDIIHRQERRKEWTEVALDELMRSGCLRMTLADVSGLAWFEIDNPEDLQRAELIFGHKELDFSRFKVAFVDMDGTLYVGNRAVSGGAEFIKELRRRVGRVHFLSNNSSKAHADYAAKLAGLGIAADESDIILSTDSLLNHLREQGITRVFVLGSTAMRGLLARHGIVETAENPQAVVLGYDTETTYARLAEASLLLQDRSRPFWATHLDKFCPTERGPVPDAGALAELLRVTTGRVPDLVLGKPNCAMVAAALRAAGAHGSEAVFFGDRIYTDYALARASGGYFVGVLTGEATRRDYEECDELTVFPSVADVFDDSKE